MTAERSNLRLARRSTSCPASRGDEKTNIEKVVESSTFDLVEEGCRFVVEIVLVETIREVQIVRVSFLSVDCLSLRSNSGLTPNTRKIEIKIGENQK